MLNGLYQFYITENIKHLNTLIGSNIRTIFSIVIYLINTIYNITLFDDQV